MAHTSCLLNQLGYKHPREWTRPQAPAPMHTPTCAREHAHTYTHRSVYLLLFHCNHDSQTCPNIALQVYCLFCFIERRLVTAEIDSLPALTRPCLRHSTVSSLTHVRYRSRSLFYFPIFPFMCLCPWSIETPRSGGQCTSRKSHTARYGKFPLALKFLQGHVAPKPRNRISLLA